MKHKLTQNLGILGAILNSLENFHDVLLRVIKKTTGILTC